jgi:hypothetical protein
VTATLDAVERLSDPEAFGPDDVVEPERFHGFVTWAADELEALGRHPAFDYEPGFDYHLVRLEDAIGETIDCAYQPRFPRLRVHALLAAARRHVEALRASWDDPGDEADAWASKVMVSEARKWVSLPWDDPRPRREALVPQRCRPQIRSRAPRGRRVRTTPRRARAPNARSADPSPLPSLSRRPSPARGRD